MPTEAVKLVEQRLKWWQWQEQRTERGRRFIHFLPLLGLALAAAASRVHLLLGAVVIAATVLSWLLGLYNTGARRGQVATGVRLAQAELRQARGQGDDLPSARQ